MTKEELKGHLKNKPLMDAIRKTDKIDRARYQLSNVIDTLRGVDECADVIDLADDADGECREIIYNCCKLAKDNFGFTSRDQDLIQRYMSWTDAEIERLPDMIKW
jgi:hypothetical protein